MPLKRIPLILLLTELLYCGCAYAVPVTYNDLGLSSIEINQYSYYYVAPEDNIRFSFADRDIAGIEGYIRENIDKSFDLRWYNTYFDCESEYDGTVELVFKRGGFETEVKYTAGIYNGYVRTVSQYGMPDYESADYIFDEAGVEEIISASDCALLLEAGEEAVSRSIDKKYDVEPYYCVTTGVRNIKTGKISLRQYEYRPYKNPHAVCAGEHFQYTNLPAVSGAFDFYRTVVFNINESSAVADGYKINDIGLYRLEDGTVMAPVRKTAYMLGFGVIDWDEEAKLVRGKRAEPYSGLFAAGESFSLDTETGYVSFLNRTLGFNTYVEFKDSEIFAPLEDILSICGVSDRRVYYNSQRGSITVDFTPNFDTDRITVDFGLADLEGYPAERLIFDITDKAEIENIQKICSGGVFTKLEKPPPGRSPIYRISFNNGTDIYSFMENNRGVFYSACILPEGLDTCILDYARKAFDGKAYIKEYSENSTE